MPISATGNSGTAQAGFTLVELLVALAVIGLATAVAVIAWPGGETNVRQVAERLSARLTMASHQSVLTGKPLGLWVDDQGAAFLRRERDGWRAIPSDAHPRAMAWPRGITVELSRRGAVRADPVPAEQAERAPDLRFDPLGGVEPFDVTVSGSGVAFALTVDDRGRIALAKVNHVAP